MAEPMSDRLQEDMYEATNAHSCLQLDTNGASGNDEQMRNNIDQMMSPHEPVPSQHALHVPSLVGVDKNSLGVVFSYLTKNECIKTIVRVSISNFVTSP
jgi:hypothetical protein